MWVSFPERSGALGTRKRFANLTSKFDVLGLSACVALSF